MEQQEVGASLRRGREHLGLSVEQMGERLHIDPKVIAALEEDRHDALGAPVFVRGHLRRYAEYLNLDADALQQRSAARQVGEGAAPNLADVPRAIPQPDPRRYLWPAVIVAGLLVLAGILWWALNAPAAAP